MQRSKSVAEYIGSSPQWKNELKRLREILQSTALTEEIKWGAPCYSKQQRITKILPMITAGVGLHDKYRDC